jgi:2'-5' RNA ligase
MKISLWLLPSETDAPDLQAQIAHFSHQVRRPSFAPHLTLYSPIEADSADLRARMQPRCAQQGPLKLASQGVSHSDQHYRCLVVEMAASGELSDWNDTLRQTWNPGDSRPFSPHISLLYALLPEPSRQSLLSQVSILAQYRFDRLAAMRTETPDPAGFAYQHWEFLWELPLLGKGTGG